MRKLLAIAWTDLRLQFREKGDLVFYLILPIVFTAILAASMGGSDPNADMRYPLLMVDRDKSELSQQLVATLQSSRAVRAQVMEQDAAAARFAAKDANIPALLTIPAGFGAQLLDGRGVSLGVRRAPNDSRVLAVEQEIRSAADLVSSAAMAAQASVTEAERISPFAGDAARQVYIRQAMSQASALLKDTPARVQTTQSPTVTRQSMSGAEQSSAGQLVTWVMITLLASSEVFTYERIEGTLRRLVTTPTSKATILGGKLVGRLSSGLLQMTALIVVGAVVFKLNWGRSPLALVVVMLAFALAGVALGVLMATFVTTRSQAGWLSVMFAMVMGALGGAWWPLEITPPIYQKVVQVLPTTWAMQGFSDVLVRGADVGGVLLEAGILLGFAALFFVLGIRRFRFE